MKKEYPKEQLKGFLKELCNELGRTPKAEEVDKIPTLPSSRTFRTYFGSWNNAIEASGLEKTINNKNKYTKEKLLEKILEKKEELGYVPRRVDLLKDKNAPLPQTYDNHFGSYETAIKELNLTPQRKSCRLTNEYLLEKLIQFSKELDDPPRRRDFERNSKFPAVTTYDRHFGKLSEAKRKVGISTFRGISKKTLIKYLRKAAEELGHTPSFEEIDKMEGYPCGVTFYNRFGSYVTAVEAADLPISEKRRKLRRIKIPKKIPEIQFETTKKRLKPEKEVQAYIPIIDYVDEIITPEILSKAIAYRFNESNYLKIKNTSDIIMELFGYERRIIDIPLDKKTRNIFYILEKENIVSGEKEEDMLVDSRKWYTHYWKLKTKNIIKYAKEYDISLEEKLQKEAEIPLEGDIYKKEEIWKRNIDIAK